MWPTMRLACGLLLGLFGVAVAQDGARSSTRSDVLRTALDEYVAAADDSYGWKLAASQSSDDLDAYVLDLTSQTWRSEREVDRTQWRHWLVIYKPRRIATDTALLMIGGGVNEPQPPKSADRDERIAKVALATRSIVAYLPTVPNQPLVFVGDDRKPRYEDDLVAYTWAKYLDGGDIQWPAQLPMTKAAVRAMDAVQAFCASPYAGEIDVRRFVVSGASKRGWTTWLTAAVDRRVRAIIPIVIDVLNLTDGAAHHHAAYGFWAPAIRDYVRHGVLDRVGSPESDRLTALVDPYAYRRRLSMPKFMINSAGDQFFLPDSSRFYFDDLIGEKYLRYIPNTDHSLSGSDAIESLVAYYSAILTDRPRPRFDWRFEDDGSIRVTTADAPSQVLLWQATNPEARDFRQEQIGNAWTSEALAAGADGAYVAHVAAPHTGWTAYFVELTFDSGGAYPLKFTTAVRITPDVLPFAERAAEQ